jgi:dTDP-glucose 4,6-dehydratase
MTKILILGSNSFSGNHLASFLIQKGYTIIGISKSTQNKDKYNPISDLTKNEKKKYIFNRCDINHEFIKLKKLILKHKPSIIIDFLGQGMVGESWIFPELTFKSNLVSKVRLFEFLKDKNFLKKYVKISTPEVFGSSAIKENKIDNYNPSTPYALSHSSIETYLKLINKHYNFPIIISRFANFYGPFQKLYRVIPLVIHKAFNKEKFYLHGGGKSSRSFIHNKDFCNGIFKIVKTGKIGETYHFSSKEYISIEKLVQKIYLIFNLDPKKYIVNVKDRIGKDTNYKIYDQKTKNKLNWGDKINLDEGIDSTIKWYLRYKKKFKTKETKFKIKL